MERLGAEAAAELSALLEPEVPALRDVGVYVAVQEGELPEDTPWSKDLPEADGMQIDIVLDAACGWMRTGAGDGQADSGDIGRGGLSLRRCVDQCQRFL